jgi:hypothetical protein
VTAAALCAVALSCGDDEPTKEPLAPPGPASVEIRAFIGAGSERFGRSDADAVVVECTGLLAVELRLENWLLRPPRNCGATPQCGHVLVSVGDVEIEASTSTVVVPLGDAAAGSHRVRAELMLGDRTPFLGEGGEPVTDELDIEVAVDPCPPGSGGAGGQGGEPAGGAGGEPSAQGGASGQGGAGGQGGEPAGGAGGSADGAGAGGMPSAQGGAGGQGGV